MPVDTNAVNVGRVHLFHLRVVDGERDVPRVQGNGAEEVVRAHEGKDGEEEVYHGVSSRA